MRTATEVQREAGQPPGVAHQPVGRHYGQGVGLGVGIHPDDEIKALCDAKDTVETDEAKAEMSPPAICLSRSSCRRRVNTDCKCGWWLAWGWLAGSVLVPATGMCVTRKLTDPRSRGVFRGMCPHVLVVGTGAGPGLVAVA